MGGSADLPHEGDTSAFYVLSDEISQVSVARRTIRNLHYLVTAYTVFLLLLLYYCEILRPQEIFVQRFLITISSSSNPGYDAGVTPSGAFITTNDLIQLRTEQQYILNKPGLCSNSSEVIVMIVVISAPQNYHQRRAVRETWGNETSRFGFKLAFLIGRSVNEDVQSTIVEEDLVHHDIVQADFIDVYRNLTLKSVTMVRWVTSYCSEAQFLLKIDDDVLLNVWNLALALVKLRGARRTLWGNLVKNSPVVRNKTSKYYVPESMYPNSTFPNFLTGPAYLMSGDSPGFLANLSGTVPYLSLEDVFLTGFVAEKAGLVKVHHRGFPDYGTYSRPCSDSESVTSHSYTPLELRHAWNHMVSSMDKDRCERLVKTALMGAVNIN